MDDGLEQDDGRMDMRCLKIIPEAAAKTGSSVPGSTARRFRKSKHQGESLNPLASLPLEHSRFS